MTDTLKSMSKVVISDDAQSEPLAHLTIILNKQFGVAFAESSLFNSTIVNLSDIPAPLLRHIIREAFNLLEKGSVRIEPQNFAIDTEQRDRESN